MVLIAGEAGIRADASVRAVVRRPGVLFDAVHHRVLVGSPAILQSTFTQLMYLDGRYSPRFRKMQDHLGFDENRVVAWSVDWRT